MLDVSLAVLAGQLLPACRDDPAQWQPPRFAALIAQLWMAAARQVDLIKPDRPIADLGWLEHPQTERA